MFAIPSFFGFQKAGFGPTYDADAQAFFDRVTTAGGTLSLTEMNATNQLVLDLKANSLWTPMKAIYPMVGASAAACAQNLKSASFTGSFSSGFTFASTGVTPNGTSAWMNTGLNANSNLTNSDLHLSFYSRTNNMTAGYDLSCGGGSELGIICRYFAGTGYFNYSGFNTFVVTDSLGFYVESFKTTTLKGYKNNSTVVNTTKTAFTLPNLNLAVFADSRSGGQVEFSSKQCALASIGDGLTDTQASNFYTAVQAFQTTLSRQV